MFKNTSGQTYKNKTTFTPGDPRAAAGGSVSSPAKIRTARENGALGGPKTKDPADRECTCGLGDAVAPEHHKRDESGNTCPRKQAWRRQNKAASTA